MARNLTTVFGAIVKCSFIIVGWHKAYEFCTTSNTAIFHRGFHPPNVNQIPLGTRIREKCTWGETAQMIDKCRCNWDDNIKQTRTNYWVHNWLLTTKMSWLCLPASSTIHVVLWLPLVIDLFTVQEGGKVLKVSKKKADKQGQARLVLMPQLE